MDLPGDDMVEDLLKVVDEFRRMPAYPMEIHCSRSDYSLVMDMCEEALDPISPIGGIIIIMEYRLHPTHWVVVMSDNTLEVVGKSAQIVALGLMARNAHMRIAGMKT